MSEEANINTEAEMSDESEVATTEATGTIADRLGKIHIEGLSPEQVGELEKLKQEIVYVGIDDIKPSPNLARKNDIAVPKVAESIRQLGFRSPIYVDSKTDEIIIGHTRWAAAKKLGLHTVPVVYVFDLSPSKLKLLRLADNKVAEFSGWDFTELNKELEELKAELPEINLDDFGFIDEESTEGLDDFFENSEKEHDKKPRTVKVVCPDCGKEFEVEV